MSEQTSLTRDEAQAWLKRFPAHGWGTFALNAASLVAGNGLVLWMMLTGRVRGAHLIALTFAEAIVLAALAWIVHLCVPRSAWSDQPKPWKERLGLFAFLAVWLGGAYSVSLLMIEGWPDFLALLRSPQPWIDARLHWALGITTLLGIVHAVGDVAHWRSHGGRMLSTVSNDAGARVLTLILGGIPFAMPFFAVSIGAFKGIEFVAKKFGAHPEQSVVVGLLMLAAAYGAFMLVDSLIASGVAGWAIGFVLARLIAETLIAAIPLAMSYAARDPALPTDRT